MRMAYRVLAWLIAVEVLVQAAAISWAVFGLGKWIEGGGVMDKSVMESQSFAFPEEVGFAVHGINGQMIIPALALLLLVVAFFAKLPRGVALAGTVAALVVVQVLLGMLGHGVAALGILHGVVALALFAVAAMAAHRVGRPVGPAGVAAPVGRHGAATSI
jgi:Family of unknown function (DUF6220)